MGVNKKNAKRFIQLCLKMTYIFNDCYIVSSGYVISTDIDKPFVIQLEESDIELFKLIIGDFKILRIFNIKDFKKYIEKYLDLESSEDNDELLINANKIFSDDKFISSMNDSKLSSHSSSISIDDSTYLKSCLHQYANKFTMVIISRIESEKVIGKLTEDLNTINSMIDWDRFILSDDNNENEKLILSLFKNNDYINFVPKNNFDGPDIVITKSLFPLVTEKNYSQLYYATKKISSDLYVIVFDFDYDVFRIFMIHHYIPM